MPDGWPPYQRWTTGNDAPGHLHPFHRPGRYFRVSLCCRCLLPNSALQHGPGGQYDQKKKPLNNPTIDIHLPCFTWEHDFAAARISTLPRFCLPAPRMDGTQLRDSQDGPAHRISRHCGFLPILYPGSSTFFLLLLPPSNELRPDIDGQRETSRTQTANTKTLAMIPEWSSGQARREGREQGGLGDPADHGLHHRARGPHDPSL